MKTSMLSAALLALAIGFDGRAQAASAPAAIDPALVRAALNRGLPLLQKAGPAFYAGSGCISCHNNSLPAMAIVAAREHGFTVDEVAAKAAVKLTTDYMDARLDRLRQAIVPPGGHDTMSYILYGLAVEHVSGDEATEAGARYLKLHQWEDGHWPPAANRPPLESSSITFTAISLRDLLAFAPAAQKASYTESVRRAAAWLVTAEPRVTEEFAFKILGLSWAKASAPVISQTAATLAKRQQDDGGWRQLPDLETDAYATGQALVALHEAGMSASDPVYRRGAEFLLRSQAPDGSWHVRSRAEPVQIYFDAGYPYDTDQWISAAGASWAMTALALTQPAKH